MSPNWIRRSRKQQLSVMVVWLGVPVHVHLVQMPLLKYGICKYCVCQFITKETGCDVASLLL
jgi:hypothetical protein